MAVSAREILLIFRGQNYMSQAIRRVGADVGGLSRGTQLANQRQQLQIAGQRLRTTRNIATNELASIQTGSRRITQEKAIATQKLTQMRYDAQLLNNQARLSMLSRNVQRGTPLKGFTLAETRQMEAAMAIQVDIATQAIKDQELAVQKLNANEITLSERQAVLTQRINSTSQALELNTEKQIRNAQAIRSNKYENFNKIASQVGAAGKAVQMFGFITAAVMGYAADKAAQFNTQVTIAASKVKQPGMSIGQIGQNASLIQQRLINQLGSGTSVASPTDLTQATYRVLSGLQLPGSMKSQIKEATGLVQQFGNVVKANFGMTDIMQVTQGAILAMRDFQVPLKNVPKLLNTMQAAEKYGRMTMGEFIDTFNQAAPAAKAANYSFKEMAGTIAFLSTKMTTAPAATGYARLLQTLAQNAQKFNQAGYQVTDKSGKNLLPIDEIIQNIVTKAPQLAKGGVFLQNFFKQVTGQTGYLQARKVFVFLAQDLAGLDRITKQVSGDQTVLAKTTAAAAKSPGVAWAEFKNQLQAIVLILGAGAIPAFKAFAAPLVAAVKWFERLNPDTQKFIGYSIAITGILATLGGTAAIVAGGLARMGSAVALLIGSKGMAALGSEVGAVSTEMALGLGIPVVVGLIVMFHTQIMSVINDLGGLKNVLILVATAFAAWKLYTWASMLIGVGRAAVGLITSVTEIGVAAKLAAIETVGLRTALMGIAGIVVTATILVLDQKQVKSAIKTALGGTLNKEINPVTGLPKSLSTGQQISAFLSGPTPSPWDLVKRVTNSVLTPIGLGEHGKGVWQSMINEQMSSLQKVSGSYRSFLAIIHQKGSPAAFKNFLSLFQQAQLSENSSANSINLWLTSLQQASQLSPKFASLKRELKSIERIMFEINHHQLSLGGASTSNSIIGNTSKLLGFGNTFLVPQSSLAILKAKQLKKVTDEAGKSQATMLKSATSLGVVATKTYEQLYKALVKAKIAVKLDPTSLKDQAALIAAQDALNAQVTKQQAEAASRASTAAAATATKTKTTFEDTLSSIQSMYNNFLQTEQDLFGTLFQGPFMNSPIMQNYTQWGGKPTGQQLTKDLKSQINQFNTFHNDLSRLAKRGAPAQLIQQLMDLGPSALPQIKALMSLSTSQLNNYFSMFQKAQNLIQKQTMRDLNAQLDQYRKFGQNIALAIVAGLRDQNVAVTNALKKLIHSMFPDLGSKSSRHSNHHDHHRHHRHTHATQTHTPPPKPRMESGTGGNTHYHYHVNVPRDANLDTQIRHAAFRSRHRHPVNNPSGGRN